MGVARLTFRDAVRVETDRLKRICDGMGVRDGELAICTAMEDVAVLIRSANEAWKASELADLRPKAVQIAAIADRIGLVTLAGAARGVADLSGGDDATAIAATVARMVRLGERSLIALWDSQDVSI